jgi:hypothetical protein
MSCPILALPWELLHFLANYLLPKDEQSKRFFKFSSDWRIFMNTSKHHLSEWKKRSQLIVLKSPYTEKFRRSSLFRERILQLVEDPWEQIEFHFGFSFDLMKYTLTVRTAKIHARECFIDDVSLRLKNVGISFCTIAALNGCPSLQNGVIDFFHLRGNENRNSGNKLFFTQIELPISHLKALLVYGHNMVDVSCFKNIHKICFQSCPRITDVSSLANVYDLELSYCDGITDVSCLGKVSILNLRSCYNISDVSALGSVHSLNLHDCRRVKDVSSLTNVYELDLGYFQGTSLVGLENVVKLYLKYSFAVSDITMLKNVRVLRVDECPLITNFTGLDSLKVLTTGFNAEDQLGTLTVSSGLETFTRLAELVLWGHSFEESTNKVSTDTSRLGWNHLVNLRKLTLWETRFTHFPDSFVHLQSLTVCQCNAFSFLPDLPASLGYLLIEDCSKLTDLHISGVNRTYPIYHVEIKQCSKLRRLQVSRKISSMLITLCEELVELSSLNQIGTLRTKGCSKLLNGEKENGLREYEDG